MAPLIDEKYLLEQTDDNKKEIIKRIKEKITENKKRFPDWRKRPHLLRTDLPKPFLFGTETFQVSDVSAFARGDRNVSLKRITNAKKIREALLRAMTDQTGAARKTAYGRGARKLFTNQEDHHILFRTLLDNFYRDLDPDDAAELTAHLARRGSPVGNVIENLQGLDIDLHDSKMPGSLHQWARDMNIDSKSFPDLTNLDFDARTAALDDWLDLIEEPLLDRTATILSRQDFRRYGTKGLSKRTTPYLDRPDNPSKQSWLEYLTNQRENVKARANLLDKYPILAEDLDSPNIRPELKARYEKALSLVPEEELKTFKALTSEQEAHALAWFNDREYRKTLGKPTGEVTELGRRLGGIGDTISTKPDNHLFRNTLAVGFQKVKQVGNLPGVKPTLEVLDTVRKNPVVATVSTLPILSAFDIAEAATSGIKLYQNQWDTQDEELAKREKLVEQLKFTAGTAGVSSLTPAGFVTGPISLMSGATALVLENRNNREKTKRALVDARINKKVPVANDHLDKDDPQYGVAELKQWDQNIIDKTKSKYWNWVNEQDWLSPYHSNQLNLTN